MTITRSQKTFDKAWDLLASGSPGKTFKLLSRWMEKKKNSGHDVLYDINIEIDDIKKYDALSLPLRPAKG